MIAGRFLFMFSVLVCVLCVAGFAQNATVEKAATAVTKDVSQQPVQAAPSKEQPVQAGQQPTSTATPPVEAPLQQPGKAEVSQATVQPVKEEVIKGIVKEIAEDGSYITIDNTKVITTKEFLEDSYLEVGDNVEVITDKTETGLKAKSYNYIFEEESTMPSVTEGVVPSAIEAPAKSK
ncbi:MAG: hypothetical protein WCI77_08380 [Candidatus Omnitrophota bacterium]